MELKDVIRKVGTKDELDAFLEVLERAHNEENYRENIRYKVERREGRSFSWQFAGLFDWSKTVFPEKLWQNLYQKLLGEGY